VQFNTRHSLRPLLFSRTRFSQDSDAIAPRECGGVSSRCLTNGSNATLLDPSPAKRGEGGRPKAGRVGVVVANTNARALRKSLTPQEVKVWVKLRELKPLSFHFRRQAPIGRYIVDFASFGSRVVVEIDGGQHGLPQGAQVDRERDAFLQSQGFNVLRYWNSDVDGNLEGVMESILSVLNTPTPPLRGDPPHASRGRD